MRVNEKGFICCPLCKKPTKTKVVPETVLKHFPLYCTWCKKEIIIDMQSDKPEPSARAVT